MPDNSFILGAALLILGGIGIYAISRLVTRHGKLRQKSTMADRGRIDTGSPIFPSPPTVVDDPPTTPR